MEPCRVIVCDLKDAVNYLSEMLLELGFKVEEVKLALVKPNICGVYHPSLDLLSSIVEFLLPKAESVVSGETRSMRHEPKEQFEKLGVTTMLKRFDSRVQAVDLSDGELVEVRVPHPHVLEKVVLPKTALESDVLVNVPKVGTLSRAVTPLMCALKNLFGLLPQKRKYLRHHLFGGINKVIADIAQVVKPDLNIVDAGSKVILSVDALAVDVVACRFVDLDPLTVGYWRLVSEHRGEKLETFMKKIDVIETRKRD